MFADLVRKRITIQIAKSEINKMPTQLANLTANQHFISQTEQQLNAINPNAKSDNQRIYSFSVEDPGNSIISLDSPDGRAISQTLSLRDVFSFDVLPLG